MRPPESTENALEVLAGAISWGFKPPSSHQTLTNQAVPHAHPVGTEFLEHGTPMRNRGSRHYCAPELRNPKIFGDPRLAAADIYSLGKVLFWLFSHQVFDGHEDDYGGRQLFKLHENPHFIWIDELVVELVTKDVSKRLASAAPLKSRLALRLKVKDRQRRRRDKD